VQANLKVIEDIAIGAPIVEIKTNAIDLNATLEPHNIKKEDLYVFLKEEAINHPRVLGRKKKVAPAKEDVVEDVDTILEKKFSEENTNHDS
jgi:hypothetical protein